MKVGYIRVSTQEQNLDRQSDLIKNTYEVDRVFEEKVSGKNTKDRPEFNKMLEFVREGDTVYVESFSRLSRSTQDLLKTVQTLNEKGVGLVSDKEKLDTTTPHGKFMLTIFAALSEFERENTLERQREGIAAAKARGKVLGRKRLPETDELRSATRAWAEGTLRLKEAVKESGVSEATFFRYCKREGLRKEVA